MKARQIQLRQEHITRSQWKRGIAYFPIKKGNIHWYDSSMALWIQQGDNKDLNINNLPKNLNQNISYFIVIYFF